jgi:kynureninase
MVHILPHWNWPERVGQITPVREICDMAHDHNIEVIVDAAHSFAHLDYFQQIVSILIRHNTTIHNLDC